MNILYRGIELDADYCKETSEIFSVEYKGVDVTEIFEELDARFDTTFWDAVRQAERETWGMG